MAVKRICCIGAGYVGGPTMAVIAKKCPHIQVNVVDINAKRIAAWNEADLKRLPVYEPGLSEVIYEARGRNLHFSTNVEQEIRDADMIFLSVNTPTKSSGVGAGQASDLRWIEACTRVVAKAAVGHTIVIEKSTLPVRTAEAIQTILSAAEGSDKSFSVLSNPEFLAEGTAIKDLESPERVLIGGNDKEAMNELALIYENWVPKELILRTNLWSSELSKLTANAFLAQRVSSINSIAAICEATGANIHEVSNAIGSDSRIGDKFLQSGPGFGGSCFQKDILNLVYLCRHYGLDEVSNYWEQVISMNKWQQERIARIVVEKLFNTVAAKKIALFGFAFKANTNDTRESPAICVAKQLLNEGAHICIHDPKVETQQIENDLNMKKGSGEGNWSMAECPEAACDGADACIVMTEWQCYENLNWSHIISVMRKPAWLFDTRGITDGKAAKEVGMKVWRVGEGL